MHIQMLNVSDHLGLTITPTKEPLTNSFTVVSTILAPDEVRALEVANRDGQWISAPPRPGCFIINVLETGSNP